MGNLYRAVCFSMLLVAPTLVVAKQASKAPQMPPTQVEAVTAQRVTWQQKIHSTGTLKASQGVMVRPEIAGRITKIFFKSGQEVAEGTPLIQLNQSIVKAELQSYQAALALKQLTFTRASNLYQKRVMPKAEFDAAQSALDAATANVAEAQAKLEQTVIKAPFNGRLGIRLVNIGEFITAGQDIVNLRDVDPMFVDFSVPEVFSNKVKAGQTIKIKLSALPKQIFQGRVIAINSTINEQTRTLDVRAQLGNPQNVLIPGSFVEVTLYVGDQQEVVKIPQTAVVYSRAGEYVYVIKEGVAKKIAVKIGWRGDADVYITDGLAKGDKVVSAGQIKLHDGAKVAVRKATR